MPSEMAKRRRKFLFREIPRPEPALVLRAAKGFDEAFRTLWRQFDAGQQWLAIPRLVNGIQALELYEKCLLTIARGEIPKRARVHEPSVIFNELPTEYQERVQKAWDRVLGRPPPVPGRKVRRGDDLDIQLHQMDDIFDTYRYPFQWESSNPAFVGSIDAAIRAVAATIFEVRPDVAAAAEWNWVDPAWEAKRREVGRRK